VERVKLMPARLARAHGPWQRRELATRTVAVAGFHDPALASAFAHMLAESGARVCVAPTALAAPFALAGEAFGAVVHTGDSAAHDALVVDATAITSIARLREIYDELHRLVPAIASSGRLVVLARGIDPRRDSRGDSRDHGVDSRGEAACVAALEGLVRSAAKELGRRGATAQLVIVELGAERRAAAIVRFLLSRRSAFITAQPLRATTTATCEEPLEYVAALDGKIAVVTGAARGIGAATAAALADEGAHVVCVDRPADEVALARIARAIRGELFIADVRDPETPRRLAEHLCARHGGVDIVVHNAGVTRDRTLANMTADEWEQVLDVNLAAVVRITEALLPTALRDDGRVICLSSVAGIAGNVGQTNYAASKAGLIGYIRALARDLAPRGITVNAIAPGFIETRMTAAIPFVVREAARRLSALGQGGEPRDVADAIAFLAQPAAAGITGDVVRVCGGALIGA
jgi:3-oxoacyl-[acyl-carrier protein] reductase